MSALGDWFGLLPGAGVIALAALSLFSAGHALLNKRKPQAGLGWMIVCLGWPAIGPLAYWVLGVNRIETRARKLGSRWPTRGGSTEAPEPETGLLRPARLPDGLSDIARTSWAVTRQPLVGGNRVTVLENGEAAYPAMLEAIASARRMVFLSTYIFDNDATGRRFVDALCLAVARDVDVRVVIDGIGERYSLRRVGTLLRRRGVRVERFLPPSLRPPGIQINLRNHRKLLIVDGRLAFTGGMNIGDRHLLRGRSERKAVKDLHFEVQGPVVGQMERTFLDDWGFVTRASYGLHRPEELPDAGTALCRGVSDGPNEERDKLRWILLGGLSAARRNVRIMTPYFLPDAELIAALNAAALRGVLVEVVLPERNNLPYVAWAARAGLAQLLTFGVHVFMQPGPFVHTKLFLVDDAYAMIGSANLDPRSLRLNFEFNLEVYGGEMPMRLIRYFEAARELSREISETELSSRSLAARLRDGIAAIFSPYL